MGRTYNLVQDGTRPAYIEGGLTIHKVPSRLGASLVVLMLFATTFAAASAHGPATRDTGPRGWISDPALRELLLRASQNISKDELEAKLTNLTTTFKTRYVHASNHVQVVNWVYNEFKAMGYEPQRWAFRNPQDDARTANIIATINGTGSSEFYIISAHLDTINFNLSWSFPESAAPGADDDGTGLVAMLAIAKVMHNYRFHYGIRFIAFDDEELDYAVGSTRYAQNLTDSGEGKLLRGILNVDMIGYNSKYLRMDVVYFQNILDMWDNYILPANNEFYFIEHLDKHPDPNDPNSWGDVEPFWDHGYKGLAFAENIWPHGNASFYTANPFYHTENDTVDKVNFELVNRTTRLILTSLMWMARPTLPELTISNIALPRGPVYDGDLVAVNATVRNSGNLNASLVQVDLQVDGEWTASANVSVPVKASANVTFNWASIAGDHEINITADPGNALGEWDDGNNSAHIELTVQVRPDIELAKFDILEDHINTGELAQLSIKAINHGPAYIECWLDVTDNQTPSVHPFTEFIALDPGAQWEHVFDWASNINGTHILEGRLTRCSPADRIESNDRLSDSIVVNGRPLAVLAAVPNEVLTFQDISFSATASYDDIGLTLYRFDFGDGNETGWTNMSVARHNFTRDGIYKATLQVKDTMGLESDTVSATVTVDDRPPVAVPKADRTAAETGAPITFSSDSYDVDGKVLVYNWSILPGGVTSAKATFTASFPKPGNFTVRLVVTDDDGNLASNAITITIADRPPKAALSGPRTVQAGAVAHFSANGSSDPEGDALTYSWDFGDGARSSERNPAHVYTTPNNYTVTLTVMDKEKKTGTATLKITVTKKPLIGEKTLADAGVWTLGACAAVLLVLIVYTTAPSRPAPREMPRPRKKRPVRKKVKVRRKHR